MKKHVLLLAALFALAISFTACNKDEVESPAEEEVVTSEDLTALQNLFQDTEDEMEGQIEKRDDTSNDCPTVTVEPDDGTFPRTITIDYGSEGCEGPNGRIRKGQIVIAQTDSMKNEGAVRTVTLVDFYVDEVHIQGTKVFTNLGLNENGKPAVSREIEGSITYPDGSVASWEASHVLTQIAGANTPTIYDNIFKVTGGSSGVNRNGVDFSATIIEPLIKAKACPWIQRGVKEVSFDGHTRTISYGEGNCDPFAIVTFPNGHTHRILLKPWWRP